MKNLINLAVLFLLIGITATSCKKDKTNNNPMETNMDAILTRTSYFAFDEALSKSYEIGFSFSSSKNGKISKLGLKLPENGTYKVSLWDFDSEQKLDSVFVTNSDSSKFNYASITPRSITSGKRYVISVNTNYKNYFCSTGILVGLFPFTSGSITFFDQRAATLNTDNIPNLYVQTSNYCGIAGFVFQAD